MARFWNKMNEIFRSNCQFHSEVMTSIHCWNNSTKITRSKNALFRTGYLISSYAKELTSHFFIIYQKEYYNQLIIKPLFFFKGIL